MSESVSFRARNSMSFFSRVYNFIKRYLLKNPQYVLWYGFWYFLPGYVPRVLYYPNEEISRLLTTGKSLIRFGDGEIYIVNGGGIAFQKYDERLASLMNESIKKYTDESLYVLALNRVPLAKTNQELRKHKLLTCWLPSKIYYNLYFNKKAQYLDAAMFYFKETIPNYFEDYLKTKHLICVTNAHSITTLQNNKSIPFTEMSFIETPENDAFTEYDRIKQEVKKAVSDSGVERAVVLVAFGPAGKALAYELSREGIQTIDIGQGITAAYTGEDHSLSQNIRVLE